MKHEKNPNKFDFTFKMMAKPKVPPFDLDEKQKKRFEKEMTEGLGL